MDLNTRLTYDESITKRDDALSIISRCEKIAVRYGLYNEVTARIDPEGTVFYDIRLWIKTCKNNPEFDTMGMYLYFQFVPSDKYFAMSLTSDGAQKLSVYPADGIEFYDTSLCAILNLTTQIKPDWASINDYFAAIRMITLREHNQYNPR